MPYQCAALDTFSHRVDGGIFDHIKGAVRDRMPPAIVVDVEMRDLFSRHLGHVNTAMIFVCDQPLAVRVDQIKRDPIGVGDAAWGNKPQRSRIDRCFNRTPQVDERVMSCGPPFSFGRPENVYQALLGSALTVVAVNVTRGLAIRIWIVDANSMIEADDLFRVYFRF